MKKKLLGLLAGVLAVMSMTGCGAVKYKVDADFGYKLDKDSYAAGEEVTAVYDMIGTDSDYTFYCENDDVSLKQEYDSKRGYVITFTMPAHDVKLGVKRRSSMEMDPDAIIPDPSDPPVTGFMPLGDIWTCPECNAAGNVGGYCSNCGAKKPE
jgi:hypothetical protein